MTGECERCHQLSFADAGELCEACRRADEEAAQARLVVVSGFSVASIPVNPGRVDRW